MRYELAFKPKALKEWSKVDLTIKNQFKKKFKERLSDPKIPKDRLKGYANICKIKLRTSGYRLAYEVRE